MRMLGAVLCIVGLCVLAAVLPVVPVQQTRVVAPIPGPDGLLQPAPTRMVNVSLVELLRGRSGVSYSLDFVSLAALAVLGVGLWFLARVAMRRIARTREQAARRDHARDR